MSMPAHIVKSVRIKANTIYVNGSLEMQTDTQLAFGDFAKEVYKRNKLAYPKFFKMDGLSKLAMLGAHFLFEDEMPPANTAIILSNKASSLATDRKHQTTIEAAENYFPSPAVFVYTLPNIAIGEISIKYGLQSENAFFIFDTFNPVILSEYTTALLLQNKTEQVLCGWVEFEADHYEAFLYLVNSREGIAHTKNEIEKLYKIND